MNKFLLSFTMVIGSLMSAGAVAWLPPAEITGENVANGSVTLTWDYNATEEPCDYFQVIVYKKHKATEAENFVLAETDFSSIESKGTMTKSENRGAIWDFIPECPGWWVKYPMYMNGAMGIDAFFYYTGSDNADIFGGAYMVSPDYDMTNVTSGALKLETSLAAEAISVSGGFAMWAWNTNWYSETNIDYKPLYGCDIHYDDLSTRTWKNVSETLAFPRLEDYSDQEHIEEIQGIDRSRTRVMFYGSGYSVYWIDGFKLSVDLAAGDEIDYGAEIIRAEGNTATIDTSADTENDYVYAYEVRPVRLENDEYRGVTTVRFVDYAYPTPRHIIGHLSGVENVATAENDIRISTRGGMICIEGADNETAQVFNIAGQCVYTGEAGRPISVDGGVYIVRVGEKVAKIVL